MNSWQFIQRLFIYYALIIRIRSKICFNKKFNEKIQVFLIEYLKTQCCTFSKKSFLLELCILDNFLYSYLFLYVISNLINIKIRSYLVCKLVYFGIVFSFMKIILNTNDHLFSLLYWYWQLSVLNYLLFSGGKIKDTRKPISKKELKKKRLLIFKNVCKLLVSFLICLVNIAQKISFSSYPLHAV